MFSKKSYEERVKQHRRVRREVFPHLAALPLSLGQLADRMLVARVCPEDWQIKALEAGWEPPREWHKQDREEIRACLRWMVHETSEFDIDANWKLVWRGKRPSPLQEFTEQVWDDV